MRSLRLSRRAAKSPRNSFRIGSGMSPRAIRSTQSAATQRGCTTWSSVRFTPSITGRNSAGTLAGSPRAPSSPDSAAAVRAAVCSTMERMVRSTERPTTRASRSSSTPTAAIAAIPTTTWRRSARARACREAAASAASAFPRSAIPSSSGPVRPWSSRHSAHTWSSTERPATLCVPPPARSRSRWDMSPPILRARTSQSSMPLRSAGQRCSMAGERGSASRAASALSTRARDSSPRSEKMSAPSWQSRQSADASTAAVERASARVLRKRRPSLNPASRAASPCWAGSWTVEMTASWRPRSWAAKRMASESPSATANAAAKPPSTLVRVRTSSMPCSPPVAPHRIRRVR